MDSLEQSSLNQIGPLRPPEVYKDPQVYQYITKFKWVFIEVMRGGTERIQSD